MCWLTGRLFPSLFLWFWEFVASSGDVRGDGTGTATEIGEGRVNGDVIAVVGEGDAKDGSGRG